MALSNHKLHDSSDSEDDPWEMVDDETTPLAMSPNKTTIPDNYIGDVAAFDSECESHEHQLETVDPQLVGGKAVLEDTSGEYDRKAVQYAMQEKSLIGKEQNIKSQDIFAVREDFPVLEKKESTLATKPSAKPLAPNAMDRTGPGESSGSFTTAVSSIVAECHMATGVDDGGLGVNHEEDIDTLVLDKEQEVTTGTLLDLPEKILGSVESKEKAADEDLGELAAYYDEKLQRWMFPEDAPAGVYKLLPPTAAIPENTETHDTPIALKKTELIELVKPDAPVGPAFNLAKNEIVGSLSEMGFQKELIEKTIEDLHHGGKTKIDCDSVIDKMTAADSPEKVDAKKSEISSLMETLSNMGFKKEQVEKAVSALHEEGVAEIDENSIIEEMYRKKNDGGRPWDTFVEFSAQEINQQHQLLRRRTQNVTQNIGISAKELWSNVRVESQRLHADLKAKCNEADIPAHTARATTNVKFAASSVKDSICRANEEYHLTDKLATAAVVGGATLLALGNPRAGVGIIAVAGATLAAGEVMKKSRTPSTSTFARDCGVGEPLHVD